MHVNHTKNVPSTLQISLK